MSKETKLHSRGDHPYKVLERINNNAYKLDLTINVAYLSYFDVGYDFPYLSTNNFKEGKMIRIKVFQMFQLDLLHNPRPRIFNEHSFFILKIG